MPTTTLDELVRTRPAEVFGVLGLASGSLSAAWGQTFELAFLQPVAMVFLLEGGALLIGVFFALAMGIAMATWVRKPWVGIAVFVTTMYSWSAALHIAIRLQRNAGDDPHLIAASLCAGAAGAGLTHVGCSLFAAELRRPIWRLLLTCAVGAAFGMFFYLGERRVVDERVLFFVWQPVVAFVIGHGLSRKYEPASA